MGQDLDGFEWQLIPQIIVNVDPPWHIWHMRTETTSCLNWMSNPLLLFCFKIILLWLPLVFAVLLKKILSWCFSLVSFVVACQRLPSLFHFVFLLFCFCFACWGAVSHVLSQSTKWVFLHFSVHAVLSFVLNLFHICIFLFLYLRVCGCGQRADSENRFAYSSVIMKHSVRLYQ